MMMLEHRTAEERNQPTCHKCGADSRYLHQKLAWCRTCLDIEQYPALAHLTQEEREERRIYFSKTGSYSLINAGNMKKKTEQSSIGFAV